MRPGSVRCGLLVLLASFLVAGCAHRPEPTEPEIFLLMGQSNMSGQGRLAEVGPELAPDSRIRLYGNDGAWRVAAEPLDSPKGQVDAVSIDWAPGVGPGLAFAKRLLEHNPNRRIVLVPCALQGSSIDRWARSDARTTLYGSCLARAREAAVAGRFAGVLWYQGEADAKSAAQAANWAAKFSAMMQAFRADLRAPQLPVLVVGLGDPPLSGRYGGQYPSWPVVQRAQRELDLANHLYVSAAGLPRNPDQLHLTTTGQAVLGRRMADVWDAAQAPGR